MRAMGERINEKAIQIALNLLKMKMGTEEDIAKAIGISIEDIKELAVQINSATV